ncbi:MAG: hypothetical protein ACE37J_12040 [Pikeienuella sp.]|uniref:hypothetical protein n=1 Tax=Pikeienuella sp. TaxID=2831957 RepID=UPI00391AAFA1
MSNNVNAAVVAIETARKNGLAATTPEAYDAALDALKVAGKGAKGETLKAAIAAFQALKAQGRPKVKVDRSAAARKAHMTRREKAALEFFA